jgi:hypothetical protein
MLVWLECNPNLLCLNLCLSFSLSLSLSFFFSSFSLLWFSFVYFAVLGIEPRASCMLTQGLRARSIPTLHPWPHS